MSIDLGIFKFGVEFETLLYVKNETFFNKFKEHLTKLAEITASDCQEKRNPFYYWSDFDDDDCKRDEDIQRGIRYYLAQWINENQKNNQGLKYKMATSYEYGGTNCEVNMNFSDDEKKLPSWTVCEDSSVRMYQKDDRKNAPFYLSMDNDAMKLKTITDEWKNKLYDPKTDAGTIVESDHVIENIEIVTPPLNKKENLNGEYFEKFFEVASIGDQIGLFNNSTTSNHVHLSYQVQGYDKKNPYSSLDYFRVPENLFQICMHWWYFEPIFFAMCPWWRRENEYCNPMHEIMKDKFDNGANQAMFLNLTKLEELKTALNDNPLTLSKEEQLYRLINTFQGDPDDRSCRYAALNLLNLKTDGYGTIEIRLKHGSKDPIELEMFVKLYMFFLAAVLSKKTTLTKNQKITLFMASDAVKKISINNVYDRELKASWKIFQTFVKNAFPNSHYGSNTSKKDAEELATVISYFQKRFDKEDFRLGGKITNVSNEATDIDVFGSNIATSSTPGGALATAAYKFCYDAKKVSADARPATLHNYTLVFSGASLALHPKRGAVVHGHLCPLARVPTSGARKSVTPSGLNAPKILAFVDTPATPLAYAKRPQVRTLRALADKFHLTQVDVHGLVNNKLTKLGHYDAKSGKLLLKKL